MKSIVRSALLGAAGLVVLAAVGPRGQLDDGHGQLRCSSRTPKSTQSMQLAQRPYDPSAGSVGFKKSKKKKKKK